MRQGSDKTCLLCGEENDHQLCEQCIDKEPWPKWERDRWGVKLVALEDIEYLLALWRLEVRIRQVARCATISSPTAIEALLALGFRKDRVLDKLAQMEREAKG